MARIEIPFRVSHLRTEARSFEAVADLHAALAVHSDSELIINCERLVWFDAHLAAPFMTVVRHAKAKRNSIQLYKLPENVRLILRKNEMLREKADDSYHTTIPVRSFRLDEELDFSKYSKLHLRRKEMPRMSAALRGKFFEGIDEIFANCALHSQSPIDIVAAGQFFPRNERLLFAVSDGGRGVDGSLRAAGQGDLSPEEAIDWAMRSNNTTRLGDIPGGLGLKLIREFVRMNKGRLIVVSSAGFWSQAADAVVKMRLRAPFPGTAVVMEIVTSDRYAYDLKGSPDPQNIW